MWRVHGVFLQQLLQEGYVIPPCPVVFCEKSKHSVLEIDGRPYMVLPNSLYFRQDASIAYCEPRKELVRVVAGWTTYYITRKGDKIEYRKDDWVELLIPEASVLNKYKIGDLSELRDRYTAFSRELLKSYEFFDHAALWGYLAHGGLVEVLPDEFTFSPGTAAFYTVMHSEKDELTAILDLAAAKLGNPWWDRFVEELLKVVV